MEINSNMLMLARESRGLTQTELARLTKVSQVMISNVEQGLKQPSETLLKKIAIKLEYPEAFFETTGHIYPPATPLHRKRKALLKKTQRKIEAIANLYRLNIATLLAAVEVDTDNVPFLDLEDYNGRPEEIARALRRYWRLPKGPIENLTETIEDVGIIIIECDFESRLVDGFTLLADRGHPIIFIDKALLSDRLRFTLAHELGHIVMHSIPHPEMEDEANRFASEFLMPEEDIKPQLRQPTLERFASLKPYWKVSMAALAKRAHNLEKMTFNQYRFFCAKMSKLGYRMREPSRLDFPKERASLLEEIFESHMEMGHSVSDLSKMLMVFEKYLVALYPFLKPQKPRLSIVK